MKLDNQELHAGHIIKQRLHELNRLQSWLAQMCGVSNTAVTLWIKTGKISKEHLAQVAEYLGLRMEDLLRPRLSPMGDTGAQPQLHYLTAEEFMMIDTYRRANKLGRTIIDGALDTVAHMGRVAPYKTN